LSFTIKILNIHKMKPQFEQELRNLIANLNVKTSLHIGAYVGEEIGFYKSLSIKNVIWIEPNPALYTQLLENVKQYESINSYCFDYVITDKSEQVDFNLIYSDDRTNLGCSSIYELKEHAKLYPWVKKIDTIKKYSTTINSLYSENEHLPLPEFINIDCQGAELLALQGSSNVLPNVKAILAEVAKIELYQGGVLEQELETYLNTQGFVKLSYYPHDKDWGDVLYIKRDLL